MLQTTPCRPKCRVAGIPRTMAIALAAPLAKNKDLGDSIARNRIAGPRAALHNMVSKAKREPDRTTPCICRHRPDETVVAASVLEPPNTARLLPQKETQVCE